MDNKRIAIRRRMVKERKRRLIEKYFNVCQVGDKVQFNEHYHKHKMGVHSILDKHLWYGEYYLILQDKYCKVYLARITVWSNNVILHKISKNSLEYEYDCGIFDYWIKDAKEYRKSRMAAFFEEHNKKYDNIAVRKFSHNENGVAFYKFISKHEYKGNYYFVVKSEVGEYFVTKVVWFGFAKLVHISEREQIKNAEIFDSWIKEASQKPRKRKENA